jgi:tRNA-binding protein
LKVIKGGSMDQANSAPSQIAFDDFLKVDIRVGRIVAAEPFPQARKPAFKLTIDFGPEIGTKRSSAQITVNHSVEELVGSQVLAVVNFPPRQIGPFISEVLTLGVPDDNGDVMLIRPDRDVPVGGRLY